jgi:hypothetical protein
MFIRWLVALTVMTFALALLLDFTPRPANAGPFPWVTAGGLTIQHGLAMFSGETPTKMSSETRLSILGSLLVAFIIGPTLLFFSWRRLATEPKTSAMKPASIGFFFGATLTGVYLFPLLVMSIAHPAVASSMRSAQALGQDRDWVINGIYRVSLDAHQYKILPKSFGGGGGSYVGYRIPDEIIKTTYAEYAATDETDSTLTISGSSLAFQGASIRAVYGPDGKLRRTGFTFIGQYQ